MSEPTAYTEMRDLEKHPYSPDEKRVAEYLVKLSNDNIGAGDDPIGFLIASHRALAEDVQNYRKQFGELAETV